MIIMENIYYGEEKTIEIMQEENKGLLFYVSHNTEELFEEYIEYCAGKKLDPTEEDSAIAFIDYKDKVFKESMEIDNDYSLNTSDKASL